MSIFRCDCKPNCRRRPYAEVFFPTTKEKDGYWIYACYWHFLILRLKRFDGKISFGWCKIDTDRERIEDIEELLWDIWGDLFEIKEKLGIETENPEILKMLDKPKKNK